MAGERICIGNANVSLKAWLAAGAPGSVSPTATQRYDDWKAIEDEGCWVCGEPVRARDLCERHYKQLAYRRSRLAVAS